MLPNDIPSESRNEGGSDSKVSAHVGTGTPNPATPGEAPRMALESMLNSMAVLGPKSEKRTNKSNKEPSEGSDSGEDSSTDEEAGKPRRGKGKKKKKDKKEKKARAPKELSPEVSYCCVLVMLSIFHCRDQFCI